MQNPKSITGLPNFFSDAFRVSGFVFMGTTLCGVLGCFVAMIAICQKI